MNFKDISLPDIYLQSHDFRFFVDWFNKSLTKIKYDTENMADLYDPLRIPRDLLWMLADSMGFVYDDRLPAAFNRLVLMYFMSMIKHKGSKDGVTLAAEVNLAQFNILNYGKEETILYDRLEDTSVPVNAVYVTPHTEKGYIDVVYFSTDRPIDACIEYVRPIGMYLFQNAGVRFDARTKISVDARLTNTKDMNVSIGPTHIGHYRRDDYARMQHMSDEEEYEINQEDIRHPVYYRNAKADEPDPSINAGWRALYSLQMSNNEHIVKSLIDPIFDIGYGPQDVKEHYPDNYIKPMYQDKPTWNLRLNRQLEREIDAAVYTMEDDKSKDILHPTPAVNPRMVKVGDAIATNDANTEYIHMDKDGHKIKDDGKY